MLIHLDNCEQFDEVLNIFQEKKIEYTQYTNGVEYELDCRFNMILHELSDAISLYETRLEYEELLLDIANSYKKAMKFKEKVVDEIVCDDEIYDFITDQIEDYILFFCKEIVKNKTK